MCDPICLCILLSPTLTAIVISPLTPLVNLWHAQVIMEGQIQEMQKCIVISFITKIFYSRVVIYWTKIRHSTYYHGIEEVRANYIMLYHLTHSCTVHSQFQSATMHLLQFPFTKWRMNLDARFHMDRCLKSSKEPSTNSATCSFGQRKLYVKS